MTEVSRCRPSGVIVMEPGACTGCGTCELVCSSRDTSVCRPCLSCITIRFNAWEREADCDVCRQCEYPACLYSCPEGAILEDAETGARHMDDSRCKGCGNCFNACPFTPERPMIKYRSDGRKRKYFKCDLCRGRQGGPRCVRYCPTGALKLAEASSRKGVKTHRAAQRGSRPAPQEEKAGSIEIAGGRPAGPRSSDRPGEISGGADGH